MSKKTSKKKLDKAKPLGPNKNTMLKFGGFLGTIALLSLVSPSEALDPLGIVQPRFLILLFGTILALQFSAYAIIHYWKSANLNQTAVLTGIFNSNVLNDELADITLRNPMLADPAAAVIIGRNIGTLIRISILTIIISVNTAIYLLPVILGMIVSGLIIMRVVSNQSGVIRRSDITFDFPVDLKTILEFAAAVGIILIIGFTMNEFIDGFSLYILSFISIFSIGIPIMISLTMVWAGKVSAITAATAIAIACIVGSINDPILQLSIGAKKFAKKTFNLAIIMVSIGTIILAIEYFLFEFVIGFDKMVQLIYNT